MVLKCYYKPTRKTKRVFTPADLERISRNLTDQGFPWWILLGSVMIGAGFAWVVCTVVKYLDFTRYLTNMLEKVLDLVVGGTAIAIMIRILRGAATIPVMSRIVLALIAILLLLERMIERLLRAKRMIIQIQAIRADLVTGCDYISGRVARLQAAGKAGILSARDKAEFFVDSDKLDLPPPAPEVMNENGEK